MRASVIAIVDDDAYARSGLKDLVLSLGYEARTFESAEQFVDSGSIADTACLITDLQMPGLDGLNLHALLRRNGHRTPVIFVTAHASEVNRSRAFEGGAVGFLSKPLRGNALAACLTAALVQAATSSS